MCTEADSNKNNVFEDIKEILTQFYKENILNNVKYFENKKL